MRDKDFVSLTVSLNSDEEQMQHYGSGGIFQTSKTFLLEPSMQYATSIFTQQKM